VFLHIRGFEHIKRLHRFGNLIATNDMKPANFAELIFLPSVLLLASVPYAVSAPIPGQVSKPFTAKLTGKRQMIFTETCLGRVASPQTSINIRWWWRGLVVGQLQLFKLFESQLF
jgi:hypothetical protein